MRERLCEGLSEVCVHVCRCVHVYVYVYLYVYMFMRVCGCVDRCVCMASHVIFLDIIQHSLTDVKTSNVRSMEHFRKITQ